MKRQKLKRRDLKGEPPKSKYAEKLVRRAQERGETRPAALATLADVFPQEESCEQQS